MQNTVINDKLSSVFKKCSSFDESLKTGSSTVLTQKIEFQAALKPHSAVNDMLKDKYINLNASQKYMQNGNASDVPAKKSSSSSSIDEGEGLPQPKEVIYPANRLDYNWKFMDGGAGLMNCGNTCFLNACLQCVIHTPPLANYLMSGHHFSQCKVFNREKCILCNLQMTMKRSLTGAAESFSPKWFINNLHFIGRHFRNGRQEDAHEFLRLSLEKMQKCALFGYNNLDKYSKETTVINQIFGGFLRSQVMCLKCKHRSNTYDPLLDISLDIKNVDSLQRAFELFVAPDKLDMENAYKCEKCKQKVTALKRFSIHKPPNILTIQLKRFQFATSSFFGGGGKISKFIKYPARLNIRNFMSNKNGPPEMYSLFATIQHEGYSCQSGHYVANVRCGERWYHFNDSIKRRTSLQQCLNESSAYVLFYMKDNHVANIPQNPSPVRTETKVKQENNIPQKTNKFIGPVQPSPKNPFRVVNGDSNKPHINTPLKPIGTPLAAKREKIQINLAPKPQKYSPGVNRTAKPGPTPPSTPPNDKRIVMKIKDGKSITYEKSPDGHKKILSDDEEVIARSREKVHKKFTKKSQLVPYADDSSSESDWNSRESTQNVRKTSPPKVSEKKYTDSKSDKVVFDEKLNATTSVPGNAHLYETVTLKDKLNHTGQNHEKKKESVTSPPKYGHSLPMKRHYTDTLMCITSPVQPKHTGGEWSTQPTDALASPSIGSSHSSTHSSIHSTSDWAVTPNSKLVNGASKHGKQSDKQSDRDLDNSGSSGKDNGESGSSVVERKETDLNVKSQTNLKRQAMQEQLRPDDVKKYSSSPFEVVSDKQSLLSPESSSEHKHKKRKKHKKHKHRDEDREKSVEQNGYSDHQESSHKKKKKKKKKHRHKYESESEEDNRASKRKLYTEDEEHSSKKRSRQESESSSEFEWVVKPPTKPYQSKSASSIQPQSWDHYSRDNVKKSSSFTEKPLKSAHDDLDRYKTVRQLQHSASCGYGAPVLSWDGNKSHLDIEKEHDYVASRKRSSSDDEYDRELDRGKVKKVKNKHSYDHKHNGNLFQQEQDRRYNKNTKWSEPKYMNHEKFGRQNSAPVSLHTNTHHRF